MIDIIERIVSLYTYNGTFTDNPKFWIECQKAQVREAEKALENNDLEHMGKEFADMAFVAIDGLRKMGFDYLKVLSDRLDENSKKQMSERTMEYYKAKSI